MSDVSPRDAGLKRELGVVGATMLGLGSILGTGIFVSVGIAAGVAGPAVLLAIFLAGGLATCNALSSAQLAAAHPVSGGTYEYGYRLLNPTLGFTAGWLFVCAKSASAAAAALGGAGYSLHLAGINPEGVLPWVGFGISVLVTGLVLGGLRRSSVVNICIVSVTLLALMALSVAGLLHIAGQGTAGHFRPFFPTTDVGPLQSLLHATALMFVAYTGYGRVATMGEEVRTPRKTIPRAIIATLLISAFLYMLVAFAAIGSSGTEVLGALTSDRTTPLGAAALALKQPGLAMLVSIGAVTAMLGVLLNLILGLSRVSLAMARRGDLPHALARLSQTRSPSAAIIFVGAIIAGLSLIGDISMVWSFSAFTVLVYYAITNSAALRLPAAQRLYPPIISWLGLAGCVFLAFFLPSETWLMGMAVILLGLGWRCILFWMGHYKAL